MTKFSFASAFAVGLAVVGWIGVGFTGSSWLALAVTGVIAAVFLLGAIELHRFRALTVGLDAALQELSQPPAALAEWLERVPAALRTAVRTRVEGDRGALPGPALTPYLVALLVMLGMLGTFLGMVVTFRGAVFALEGSTDLQAIRAALAEPVRGLGLSFGTSVAGVAASAMLGLMSALTRRERLDVARRLDAHIAGVLQPFSLVHQRQETFRALQAQAVALPQVVGAIEAMMERIESRSRALDEQLLERHAAFQREAATAYTELARSVGGSLQDSLAAGARSAGETIRPVVEGAMAQIVRESQVLHARLAEVGQAQVAALSEQFGATARIVSETWAASLQAHARSSDQMAAQLRQALASFNEDFEQRSTRLLASVEQSHARTLAAQAEAEQQRAQAWNGTLHQVAGDLQSQWARIADDTTAQNARTIERVAGLLDASHELVQARAASESRWTEQHAQRMDQLAVTWRAELGALREEESRRGQAAVERLDELQAAVARHLATLGAALEAPITRLLHTASEVPQAAAGVIAQLREEMSRAAERDNLALQERTALLEQLTALLGAVNQAAGEQRSATEALVASATAMLEQSGARFAEALGAESAKAAEQSAHLTAGAVELASVAEAFGEGVQQFQASSDRMMESLQGIAASLERSTARSDEQLAYYVAQAREVIDLSIASQQGLVEKLREVQARPARAAAPVAEEVAS